MDNNFMSMVFSNIKERIGIEDIDFSERYKALKDILEQESGELYRKIISRADFDFTFDDKLAFKNALYTTITLLLDKKQFEKMPKHLLTKKNILNTVVEMNINLSELDRAIFYLDSIHSMIEYSLLNDKELKYKYVENLGTTNW